MRKLSSAVVCVLSGIFIVCVMSVVLTACGASESDTYSQATSDGYYSDDFAINGFDNVYDENYSYESDKEVIDMSDEKLVYTCDISIESMEYPESKSAIQSLIKEFGCFIESESEYNNAYGWYESSYVKTSGTLTLITTVRVPASRYQEFLSSLEQVGVVTSRSSRVDNISTQYNETAALIESLEIQQQRLLDMYDSAHTIEDMLYIEDRLTTVQSKLNVYKTNLSAMDTDVAYSTVRINLEEVMEYNVEEKTDTFFDRLGNTVKKTWAFFWELLEWLLFTAIELIPFAVIVVPIVCAVKHLKKRALKKHGIEVGKVKE